MRDWRRFVRYGTLTLLAGLAALLAACEGDDGEATGDCEQGETRACTCDGGETGSQVCGAYETWAACLCEAPGDVVEDTAEDTTPDVVILPDGAECTPDCAGKVCGFDGCGGLCGTCAEDANCLDGQCMLCGAATTCCDYPFGEKQDALPVGASCEHDMECAYGECLMPGEGGNGTNDLFGFCTRGCNCNESEDSQLSQEEKQSYDCASPPGNQGGWRHVVLKCSTVEDCQAVDPAWTACEGNVPDSGTFVKVCTALSEE